MDTAALQANYNALQTIVRARGLNENAPIYTVDAPMRGGAKNRRTRARRGGRRRNTHRRR